VLKKIVQATLNTLLFRGNYQFLPMALYFWLVVFLTIQFILTTLNDEYHYDVSYNILIVGDVVTALFGSLVLVYAANVVAIVLFGRLHTWLKRSGGLRKICQRFLELLVP
jgi:hypothetical protein